MPTGNRKRPRGRRFPVRIVVVAALAVAAVAIGAALYLSASSENAVYVVTTVTYYEDDEATVTTYELDEHGNVLSSSSDDESGETVYTVDENGFYTTCTYSYEDDDGETVTVAETRTITEADEDGRPLTMTSTAEYSTGTVLESTISYTYRDDGTLRSVTTVITGGYTTEVTYTTTGFLKTYELTWAEATSSTRLYEYDYEMEDGQITACTITNQDDEYGILEFEYDKNGNLVTYIANGTVLYEYTYTKVNEPSLAAQIASALTAASPII